MTRLLTVYNSSFFLAGPLTGSTLTASSFSTFPPTSASVTSFEVTATSTFNNAGQWASLQYQQQQPLFTAAASQPSILQATPPVGAALNNQVRLIV